MMRVIIKKEFRDPGEPPEVYHVLEDNGDRLLIAPEAWQYRIVPVSLVADYMVEEVKQ